MIKKNDLIKVFFKFIFATAIIVWLIKSDRLDFSLLTISIKSGIFFLGLCIILTQDLLCFLRWKWLLEISSGKKISFKEVVKVGWIGLFFNSALPGAVTGDLIKLVYTKKLNDNFNNTYLIITAFLDRILGLAGLISLTGLFSLMYYDELITYSPKMKFLIQFNFFLFAVVAFLIIPLFSTRKTKALIFKINKRIPIVGERINLTLLEIWKIGKDVKALIKAYLMSVCSQFLNVFAFWVLTSPFYNHPLKVGEVFTFIPFGLITVAIPISPSGLGVGHLIFDTLFSYVTIPNGASLFNLYFLAMVSVNIFGVVPYLLSSTKK